MKKIIKTITSAALLTLMGCTSNFEDYNTNHYQIHEADPSMLLTSMIETTVNIQQNDSQMQDQMVGTLGGYLTLANRWGGTNFDTFNASDEWNAIPWNTPFEKIYGNFFKIEESTNGSGHFYAMAKLVRAITMLRIADCYGPMPYSKVANGQFYVPYDSQEEVYTHIMEDCANAATVLFNYANSIGNKPLEGTDPIYNGDYQKWAKLANSIRLRVAIRISSAYPELAKQNGMAAMSDQAGLIESNEDNAMLSCGTQSNPYYLASASWQDLRVNASIVDYMKGYKDPRSSYYFTNSTFGGHTNEIIGMRSGTAGFAKADVAGYSMPNFSATSDLLVFCAAETAFLRAEAALKGWGGDAKSFYEQGIRLSMTQYNVSQDKIEAYITDEESIPGSHSDPRSASLNYTPTTQITIAWDNSATTEQKLERIITQKWIANYPLGLEAWAEFRRTGYPELFPCVDNLNTAIITNNTRGMRRLRFPYTEKQNNSTYYNGGVSQLGGPDNEATDLVWAKKSTN